VFKPSIEFVNYPSIADIGWDGTRILFPDKKEAPQSKRPRSFLL
jgi:hypothetical protein